MSFPIFCLVIPTRFFKPHLQGHLLHEIWTDTQPPNSTEDISQFSIAFCSSYIMTISFYWGYLCLSPLENHALFIFRFFVCVPNMEPDTS